MLTQTISDRSSANNPCYKCPDREPGCHGKCEKHITWKAERDDMTNQAFRQRQHDRSGNGVLIDGIIKRKEKWRKAKQ